MGAASCFIANVAIPPCLEGLEGKVSIMDKHSGMLPRIPVSTYRVQLNKQFRFVDCVSIVSYLGELGITDLYSSPFLKARPGSMHGYDLVDPTTINPEIGSEADFNRLVAELRKHRMGHILDIVPNHMCVESPENRWWMDVLENGRCSPYAPFFQIDWEPVKHELKDKILLPVLGSPYGEALESQELRLFFDGGAFYVNHYEHRFPIAPETYPHILTYGIERLAGMGTHNPHHAELLSTITALSRLPSRTESNNERIAERYREKEVAKKRLIALCRECPEIMDFISDNVRTLNGTPGDLRSFDLLDALLGQQVYRLSHWRVATEEINYRRFFDINSLGAIRMELPAVFDATHALILRLVGEGKVTGLRVDHPDGLYDPSAYFQRLQRSCFVELWRAHMERLGDQILPEYESAYVESEIMERYEGMLAEDPQYKAFYIVGEKILIKSERMPEEWPIFSTTGYVFLNSVNGIFIDTRNASALETIYSRFIGSKLSYQDAVYEKKKLVMKVAMSGEVNTLGNHLNHLSEKDRHTRDFTLNSLTDGLIEVIACFPVYRSYINGLPVRDKDRQYIDAAIARARRKNPATSAGVYDFIHDVLSLRYPDRFTESDRKEWLDFVMRFQQITGPITAKGVEDTAFYVYNRLVSLNEVGGNPEKFGTTLDTFHGQNIERLKFWPQALITTSTHDTKRGEDARARLNVLSEMPDRWRERLVAWRRLNKRQKIVVDGAPSPDRNEEYLLYQTLAAVYPAQPMTAEDRSVLVKRVTDYTVKAAREAKVNTSWINPQAAYEEALGIFIQRLLSNTADNQFLQDFEPFQRTVSYYGMYNSLSQTLLKITAPGIPDFYQGTELWNFRLVDPDNRGPIDFDLRRRLFAEIKKHEATVGLATLARELSTNMADGRIKLFLTHKALTFRKLRRELFERGEYVPLETTGAFADSLCAFARRLHGKLVVTAAPRFLTRLPVDPGNPPFGETAWRDTAIAVTLGRKGAEYLNIFTGETVQPVHLEGTMLRAADLFSCFPVALLIGEG